MDTLRMWQHLISGDRPVPPSAAQLFQRALAFEESGRSLDSRDALAQCVAELEAAESADAAVANHKLAVFELDAGNKDQSVYHAVRSVFLYSEAQDLGGIYAALHNLAVIHGERGEPALAETARRQSARARRELLSRKMGHLAESGEDSRGNRLRLLRRLQKRQARDGATRTA